MTSGLKPVLAQLAMGRALSEAEAEEAFGVIMSGAATVSQIAALLMAMRVRGETVSELTGAVRAMRARMITIDAPSSAIDVCGTGGDGAATLNVSTAVTFVVAGCGIPVAKHGNRAQSSETGGADVLARLGVGLDVPFARLPEVLRIARCVFLFAPRHHAALRYASVPRSELGIHTIFNLLGPLANPAGVKRQLVGVFSEAWTRPMAEVLRRLGSERAWVVHGRGLDELTLAGDNHVVELRRGTIREFTLTPEEAGLSRAPISAIRGGNSEVNAGALLELLRGSRGPYRDTVLLNAAAALVVAGRAESARDGVEQAAAALDRGAALAALESLRHESQLATAS